MILQFFFLDRLLLCIPSDRLGDSFQSVLAQAFAKQRQFYELRRTVKAPVLDKHCHRHDNCLQRFSPRECISQVTFAYSCDQKRTFWNVSQTLPIRALWAKANDRTWFSSSPSGFHIFTHIFMSNMGQQGTDLYSCLTTCCLYVMKDNIRMKLCQVFICTVSNIIW